MFKPSDFLICISNTNSPNLVIGRPYRVESVVNDWWVKLIYGSKEMWGVKLHGDDTPYHHSLFRPLVIEDIAQRDDALPPVALHA